jgi:predicted amidohydrolase YtcJ
MRFREILFACVLISLLVGGCNEEQRPPRGFESSSDPDPAAFADAVYQGGVILTMAGDAPETVEALAVKDGRILSVGTREALAEVTGEATRIVDLQGQTLLPGFIDAHGHIFNAGFQQSSANLLPPPDGEGDDIDSLVTLLRAWQSDGSSPIAKSGVIIGFGYDDSQLAERRHPTADDLDRVSTELPVLVIHQSGHLGAMNHKALELVGYGAETPDPPGGMIRRTADGKTPNGVLEEMALFRPLFEFFGGFDSATNELLALAGVDAYVRFGYTTAQEGRASRENAEVWRRLADDQKVAIDVAVYPDLQAASEYMADVGTERDYRNHVRIAGVKLSLDGSPQGKTAWLTQPYLHPPENQPEDYAGYPAIADPEERQRLFDLAFENNWQMLVHCNGDAASDAMIAAITKSEERFGRRDRRNVMIHSQTVREDQLDRMAELGIVPSFFSMHTFYWGDWHRDETLGAERAARISPTRSALRRGMRFTEHHDAPVALPSSIMILHTTVNRTSRSGQVIGEDQRVPPFIALKALTEWAAWQYFEDDRKGTLAPGKLADLVILDRNPLEVPPEILKEIEVVETIKEGTTVYRQP